MIVRAKIPPLEYEKVLKQPYMGYVFTVPFGPITRHFFCEGQGRSGFSALSKERSYELWLEGFRNPWWKRIFGAPVYSIEVVELPEPSIYVEDGWPPIDLGGPVEGTKC